MALKHTLNDDQKFDLMMKNVEVYDTSISIFTVKLTMRNNINLLQMTLRLYIDRLDP